MKVQNKHNLNPAMLDPSLAASDVKALLKAVILLVIKRLRVSKNKIEETALERVGV